MEEMAACENEEESHLDIGCNNSVMDDNDAVDNDAVDNNAVGNAPPQTDTAFKFPADGKPTLISGEASFVHHSIDQKVHVELLHLLDKAEAPDYLFKEIIDWASRAKAAEYNFAPNVVNRNAVLNDLRQCFKMHDVRPDVCQLKLESVCSRVPTVSFDFRKLLVSLLTDASLMQPENLVLNDAVPGANGEGNIDVSPWFKPFQCIDGKVDEVLSGQWYKDTVELERYSNCFVCPIIFYIDKTFIDPMKSRFNLEPLNFTLAIFNRKCRSQFKFWRTLGYLPEEVKAPDETNTKPTQGFKQRNYHLMLKHLLGGLLEVQHNTCLLDGFHLRIGNYVSVVNLRVPVAFVVADTQGADKLCGRYVSYSDKVSRLHRSCLCAPQDATDTNQVCEWVTMADMMAAIDRGEKGELNELSQHPIPDHAFREIDFGANPHGIYGATPNDHLHGLKLGIMSYLLEVFFTDNLNNAARTSFDNALTLTLPHLRQGGNRHFPRLYFPNGIVSVSNTTADEVLGIMFVTYVLALTTQGRNALLNKCEKMSVIRLNLFVEAFEYVLILYSWVSKDDGYLIIGNHRNGQRRALTSIRRIIDFICENVERKSGQGWNISKMHELLHLPKLICMYGSPMNFDSGPCERMHKDVAKMPGRRSQKRHETFTLQAANRLADRHVIDRLYKEIVETNEEKEDGLGEQECKQTCSGSSFELEIVEESPNKYEVSVHGCGVLSSVALEKKLYPNLVEFIVHFFTKFDVMPKKIRCSSEFVDESGNIFRAHHDYRAGGFWHDWGMVSYVDETSQEGFSNVPAKILCFLPHGVPGDSMCHVVCHPCQWRKQSVSKLVSKWTLVPSGNGTAGHNIPYDVVPISSLLNHCLIVPDLELPDVVYEVTEKKKWHEKL
jgi:hypothetical protein